MKCSASAPGKLILSGEYAVVFGYPGVAIPAPCTVTTTFEQRANDPTNNLSIIHSGIENEDYLHHILDAVTKITGPLSGHLTIENHIPIGRGMGSSTALVIAIVRVIMRKASCHTERSRSATRHSHNSSLDYARDDTLKEIALSIENSVNPGHSGLDFAVIWNEKPILFQKGQPPKILGITINRLIGTFASPILIDAGKPNETTPEMVRWVKEKVCHAERSRSATHHPHGSTTLTMTPHQSLKTIASCTERLLTLSKEMCHPERSRRVLYEIFRDHHRAQVALGVVPEPVQALISEIEHIGGAAKVMGAGGRTGGGGIVFALHPKPEKIPTIAQRHGMPTFALTQIHHTPHLCP